MYKRLLPAMYLATLLLAIFTQAPSAVATASRWWEGRRDLESAASGSFVWQTNDDFADGTMTGTEVRGGAVSLAPQGYHMGDDVRVNANADSVISGGGQWGFRPSLAVGEGGALYLAWTDGRNPGTDVFVAASTDGGATWGAGVKINDETDDSRQTKPSIAVDANGALYATWIDEGEGNGELYFASSADGGATWSSPKRIATGVSAPILRARGDGALYLLLDLGGSLGLLASTDGGATWGASATVNDAGTEPSLALHPAGPLYAAWKEGAGDNLFVARSTDGGLTWTEVFHESGATGRYQPYLTVTDVGDVHLAWSEATSGADTDLFFASSKDGGETWTPYHPALFGGRQYFPALASSEDDLYLAYEIDPADPAADEDVYFSWSLNGGVDWGYPALRVPDSAGASFRQMLPVAQALPDGRVYVAWIDSRPGEWNLFFNSATRSPYFEPQGEYVATYDAGERVAWTELTREVTTPVGTEVQLAARSGSSSTFGVEWGAWTSLSSFPADLTEIPPGRYFAWRATLSTTISTTTPALDAVSLTWVDHAISGRVTNEAGDPLAGIELAGDPPYTLTTDGAGEYAFTGLLTGTYTITPTEPGCTFTPASRTASVPPDATGQDFVAATSVLSLTSRYPQPGQPSVIETGGIAHRYFEVRDARGDLVPSTLVTFSVSSLADPIGALSDEEGLLTVTLQAANLGPTGTYAVTATDATVVGSPCSGAFELASPPSFDVRVEERPFTHYWNAGALARGLGGVGEGLFAYVRGNLQGGLGWRLVETDASVEGDDRLGLREGFQAGIGGGAGAGVSAGVEVAIVELAGMAEVNTDLLLRGLGEWQAAFGAPYAEGAQKAQALLMLGGFRDLSPTSAPLMEFLMERTQDGLSLDPYLDHRRAGAGVEWHPVQANVMLGAALKTGEEDQGLSVQATQADTLLRLQGKLTEYAAAGEVGLALEQEAALQFTALTVDPLNLALIVGEEARVVGEELFFDRASGELRRVEVAVKGPGNPDAFPTTLDVQEVTYRFILEGESADRVVARTLHLAALLAAYEAAGIPLDTPVGVGEPALVDELSAFLEYLASGEVVARYEVSVRTQDGVEVVPALGFDLGVELELGAGVSFDRGRSLIVERGFAADRRYPTQRYPDYDYGQTSGKSQAELIANAMAGARAAARDTVNVVQKQVDTGAEWAVEIPATTTGGTLHGAASLSSGGTTQAQPLLRAPTTFTATALSWVPTDTTTSDFAVGGAYCFQPYTVTLSPQATLALTYTSDAVGATDPAAYDLYRWEAERSSWQPLLANHDASQRVLTTTVAQLGTYAVGYDATAPQVASLEPGDVVTLTHSPDFRALVTDDGGGVDPDSVALSVAGSPVDAEYIPLGGLLRFTRTTFLPNGTYTYAITASDTAENVTVFTDTFTIDVPPPTVERVVPSIVEGGEDVRVEGTMFALSATLRLDGQALTQSAYQGLTGYTATVPSDIANGTYDLTLINPDEGKDTLVDALTVETGQDLFLPLIFRNFEGR